MKQCSKCKIEKPKSDFHKNKSRKDGLHHQCKVCKSGYTDKNNPITAKAFREKNRERIKIWKRGYRIKNGDKCKESNRRTRNKLKFKVLSHYSVFTCKPMCAVPGCLVSDLDMLCIDHINGGGKAHRKKIGNAYVYRWLAANNFPEGYQVLCFNHNAKKERA